MEGSLKFICLGTSSNLFGSSELLGKKKKITNRPECSCCPICSNLSENVHKVVGVATVQLPSDVDLTVGRRALERARPPIVAHL